MHIEKYERWFMYAEDMDLGRRITDRGEVVLHDPGVVVEHVLGASSDAAEGASANPAWVIALHDYYRSTWHPGALRYLAWSTTLELGLWSRFLALDAVSHLRHDAAGRRRAALFAGYAAASRREAARQRRSRAVPASPPPPPAAPPPHTLPG